MIIFYNTSATSLLNTLNWPTLQNRRINLRAIMLHKIINNLIGIPADSLFCITPPPHIITIIATGCHTPGSVPTYSLFFRFNRDLEPSEPQTACSPSVKIYKNRISKENLPTRFILIYNCKPYM